MYKAGYPISDASSGLSWVPQQNIVLTLSPSNASAVDRRGVASSFRAAHNGSICTPALMAAEGLHRFTTSMIPQTGPLDGCHSLQLDPPLIKLLLHPAAFPIFPLAPSSSPVVFQSAYEAVVPCGTANSICCNGTGRVLANNGTGYDGYSIAFNNAAFTLFSMNATVRTYARYSSCDDKQK